jgi:hypothetical protein
MKNFRILTAAFMAAVLITGLQAKAELKPRERNILAKEAQSIGLSKALITDNSWNKLPGYEDRKFRESLPASTKQEYRTR